MDSKEEIYNRNFSAMGKPKADVKIHSALFLISLIFLLYSFIFSNNIIKENLTKLDNQIIEIPPQHIEQHGSKSGTTYDCEIKIYNIKKPYYIPRLDYQYVDFEGLYKDLQIGDTVNFYAKRNSIYSLTKNGFDYCNLEASNNYRWKSKTWMRCLAIIAAIFFGFGCLKENHGKLGRFYKQRIDFPWGCISIIIMIISFFILSWYVGIPNVTNKFDYDKSYKNILLQYEYNNKYRR